MNTSKHFPDFPPAQPATLLSDSPSLTEVLQEVKNLRLYTGNLFMALRDMRDYIQENFHNTYNRLDAHDVTITEHQNVLTDVLETLGE